jgi:hypothetical protein
MLFVPKKEKNWNLLSREPMKTNSCLCKLNVVDLTLFFQNPVAV